MPEFDRVVLGPLPQHSKSVLYRFIQPFSFNVLGSLDVVLAIEEIAPVARHPLPLRDGWLAICEASDRARNVPCHNPSINGEPERHSARYWPTCQGLPGRKDRILPKTSGPRATLPSDRYEMMVRAVTDYAIYMLDLDGNIVSWNAGAERLKGYAETEIVGQHFSNFFTPEERAAGKPATALKTVAKQVDGRIRGGASGRTAPASGRWPFSTRSAIPMASSLALPRSPGT